MTASNTPTPVDGSVKLDKKAIFGWSMFDFANSSFTTVIVTAYFAIYFTDVLVPDSKRGEALWGLCQTISQIIVLLTAPLVGALADFSGSKKKYLFITYIGCSILTMALGFLTPGKVVIGMALYIVGNIFYSSGENIVGAFLPEIAPKEKMGFISGLSWGLGYIGGIGSLALAAFILHELGESAGYPFVWVMTGFWFLLSGIPTFMFVKERPSSEVMPPGDTIFTVGFKRLNKTLSEAKRFRQLFRFLLIFVLIYAGLNAVVAFASIIAKQTLHFGVAELAKFLILTNVVAVIGAWSWGLLQDRIGSIWAIRLSLLTWLFALVLVMCIKPVPEGEEISDTAKMLFWIAGGFVGVGMGATSSSCRALVGLFSPQDRCGEFFGLWGMFGKLGVVIGPLTFGVVSAAMNDMRWAEGAIGLYFIASFLLLSFVNEREGREAAQHAV